ncbi:MAG: gfo/Idh/MocA family oxidoreductase [Streptosporangiales bacterium]|nr:gfo/Idh/MocA family oxidoreductase [Streptosporangiales bacterium]
MTPLRVGVIGAAYSLTAHLPVYAALPEFRVTAIATAHRETAEAAAEQAGGAAAYDDYRAMVASPEVDLVDVVTRPRLHAAMAVAGLEAGKHVLCEAPLAVSAGEGSAMRDAARAAGTLAVVDMQSRFSPGLWHLRALVREGWLGTVENVAVTAFYPSFARPEAVGNNIWCADAANGASSLRVHGLHSLDLIRWVFGPLDQVTGVTAVRRPGWPAAVGAPPATSADSAAVAGTAGGAPFSLHSSWTAWHGDGWRLTAYGSAGRLVAEAAGHTGHFPVTLYGQRADDAEPVRLEPPPDDNDVPELDRTAPQYPFARLARTLAASAGDRYPHPDLPTFDDGLALLGIADAL